MPDIVALRLLKNHKKIIRKLFVWTEVLDYLSPKRESLRIFHKHLCLLVRDYAIVEIPVHLKSKNALLLMYYRSLFFVYTFYFYYCLTMQRYKK